MYGKNMEHKGPTTEAGYLLLEAFPDFLAWHSLSIS